MLDSESKMNVRELIQALQGLDPEAVVILSRDGGGNGYSPFDGVSVGTYIETNSWSGDFWDEEEDDIDPSDGVKAIVLWSMY